MDIGGRSGPEVSGWVVGCSSEDWRGSGVGFVIGSWSAPSVSVDAASAVILD